MTVTTITSRMNEKYLRNKSKHEIISLMLLFWNGSQLQETEAKLSEAVALVKKLEWSGAVKVYGHGVSDDLYLGCFICNRPAFDGKHSPDCELAAFLSSEEKG